MADEFYANLQSVLTPSEDPFEVTPNDSTDLAAIPKALYIGGAGDIVLIAKDSDSSVTFVGVPAGTQLQVRAKRILATGTTATNIVALA